MSPFSGGFQGNSRGFEGFSMDFQGNSPTQILWGLGLGHMAVGEDYHLLNGV